MRSVPHNDHKAASAFLRALDAFTGERNAIPTQYIRAFLLIALDEGKTVGEYAIKSGVSPSVMSRHVLDIGEFRRTKQPGLGLVYSKPNVMNLREHNVFLTDKGRALLHKIVRHMEY
jgi:DNA-binding MarR family transcriptional regulator